MEDSHQVDDPHRQANFHSERTAKSWTGNRGVKFHWMNVITQPLLFLKTLSNVPDQPLWIPFKFGIFRLNLLRG
jgi:hypothetical protein